MKGDGDETDDDAVDTFVWLSIGNQLDDQKSLWNLMKWTAL